MQEIFCAHRMVVSDNVTSNAHKVKSLARLLVVDDDPDNAQVIKLGLLKCGFLVDAHTNPEEALQQFESNAESYSLILSDIWMKSISGIRLAEKAKEINPNVKVLLLTGSEMGSKEFSELSASISIDGFIQKPISIRKLTDKILSLIGETKGS
jgi:two-component system, cell cycle sensor histidine kinase and response regulator CckA